MSYTKNTWQTGDIVTAEKLNHMEDGIESAGGGSDAEVLVLEFTQTGETTISVESSMTEQEMINFFFEEIEVDDETVYRMRNNLPIVIKDTNMQVQYLPQSVSAIYEDGEFEFYLDWNYVIMGDTKIKAYHIDYSGSDFVGDVAEYPLNSSPS